MNYLFHTHIISHFRLKIKGLSPLVMRVYSPFCNIKISNKVDIYDADIVRIEHTAMLVPPNTIGVVTYVNGRYIIETHTHTHGLNLYETPHLAPKK